MLVALLHVRSGAAESVGDLGDRYFYGPRAYPLARTDARLRALAYQELLAMRERARANRRLSGYVARASPAPWTSAGPTNVNGRVTGIAIDPARPARMFASTVGGVWRTRDGGGTWERVSDAMRAGVWGAVAVTPGTDEVFAGAGDPQHMDASVAGGPGLWRSNQGGAPGTWVRAGFTKLDHGVTIRIRVDPRPPHDVYLASDQGVYLGRRTARGIGWTRLGVFGRPCTDLAVDFSASPPLVYAAVYRAPGSPDNGIWKFAGKRWQRAHTGIPIREAGVIALAIAPSRPAVVYAKVERVRDGRLLGVFRTDTAAEPGPGRPTAWSDVSGGLAGSSELQHGWFNSVIEVDPRDEGVVYVGDVKLYRGRIGAAKGQGPSTTWESISVSNESGWEDQEIHDDHHAIVFDPADPSVLIVANDGGLDRSTPLSRPSHHWEDVAHGMTITEFYRIATQQSTATLIAGGTQDNGSPITYGNRTWYHQPACDGGEVALDAANSSTFYQVCNGLLRVIVNPVPHTAGSFRMRGLPAEGRPGPPVVTHPQRAGSVLAGGPTVSGSPTIERLEKSRWTRVPMTPQLPAGSSLTTLAFGSDPAADRFYVAYSGRSGARSGIRATLDGARTWASGTGLPDISPNGIAIDPLNPRRGFVAMGGGGGGSGAVLLTLDGGRLWSDVTGSGAWRLPHTPVTAVAIDPNDSSVVYAATDVGVFRGAILPVKPPVGMWTPFDDGLPSGVSVNDLVVNQKADRLVIGTMGYGAFERDLRPRAAPPPVLLVIRDNVFDRAAGAAPVGVPDPENPVDPDGDGTYEPDPSEAGRLGWWCSPDIRVDVPASAPAKNRVPVVDDVAFGSCAWTAPDCDAGTVIDRTPAPGDRARLLVQVANLGTRSAKQVRVLALWAQAAPTIPDLPRDFWERGFPRDGSPPTLPKGTPWHFVDPAAPFRLITTIEPDRRKVAAFRWDVPKESAGPKCYLAIADCPDDPVPAEVRRGADLRLGRYAPELARMAIRNVHVLETGGGNGKQVVTLPLLGDEKTLDLVVSKAGLSPRARLDVALGAPVPLRPRPTAATDLGSRLRELPARLRYDMEDLLSMGELVRTRIEDFLMRIVVPVGTFVPLRLALDPGPADPAVPRERISIISREGNALRGGISFVIRRPSPPGARTDH